MPSTIKFNIQLPAWPPAPNDIVSGLLTLTVAGATVAADQIVPKDAETAGPFSGVEGQMAVASFVYLDDAGNRSPAATLEMEITDTFPPPQPGPLGFAAVGEEFDSGNGDGGDGTPPEV